MPIKLIKRFSWTLSPSWLVRVTTWTHFPSVSHWVVVTWQGEWHSFSTHFCSCCREVTLICCWYPLSSLTDSSVCTGNLCGKVWPHNRRLIQKGNYPTRGERQSGMSWLLAAALQVHVMILCCCLFSSKCFLSISVSVLFFFFFFLCLFVYHFLASVSFPPLY